MAAMFRSVGFVGCTARHVHHEKIVLWFSICTWACGSFSIVMGLRLAAAAGSSALKVAVSYTVSHKMERSNKFMVFYL